MPSVKIENPETKPRRSPGMMAAKYFQMASCVARSFRSSSSSSGTFSMCGPLILSPLISYVTRKMLSFSLKFWSRRLLSMCTVEVLEVRISAINEGHAASKTTVGVKVGGNVGVRVGIVVALGEGVGVSGITSLVAARQAMLAKSKAAIQMNLSCVLPVGIRGEFSTGRRMSNLAFCIQEFEGLSVTPGKISGHLQFSFSPSPRLLIQAFHVLKVISRDESRQIRFDNCPFGFPFLMRRLILRILNGSGFEEWDPCLEKKLRQPCAQFGVRALPVK